MEGSVLYTEQQGHNLPQYIVNFPKACLEIDEKTNKLVEVVEDDSLRPLFIGKCCCKKAKCDRVLNLLVIG